MDSCHIFNFLFGTRKATTELSKCFTSTINEVTKRKKANASTSGDASRTNRSRPKDDKPVKKAIISSMSNQEGVTTTSTIEHEDPTSPPVSPLKQVQMKLATLVSSPGSKQQFHIVNDAKIQDGSPRESFQEFHSGTYHATLVESVSTNTIDIFEEDDEQNEVNCGHYNGNEGSEAKQTLLDNTDHYDSIEASTIRIIENPAIKLMDKQSPNDNNLVSESETTHWPANQMERSTILYLEEKENLGDNLICKEQPKISRDTSMTSAETSEVQSPRNTFDGPSYSRLIDQPEIGGSQRTTGGTRNPRLCELSNHQEDNQADGTSSKRVKNLVQSFEINTQQARQATRKLSSDSSSTTSTSLDGQSQVSSPRRKPINWPPSASSDNNEINVHNQEHPLQSAPKHSKSAGKITTAIVKPLPQQEQRTKLYQQPPKTPVKTRRAKCLNHQLSLNKPLKIEQLFQDEQFLPHLFDQLEPLDRCNAAQVCRLWRNILYSRQSYWKDLVSVIDCTQLRREHLVECIMNTLHQSAKLKQQQQKDNANHHHHNHAHNHYHHHHHKASHGGTSTNFINNINHHDSSILAINTHLYNNNQVDQDEVWRIQELCNKFNSNKANWGSTSQQQFTRSILACSQYEQPNGSVDVNNNNSTSMITNLANSKSSSIPSQISSTLSSVSISSLLSPLSESSRVDSIKEKLYSSLDDRGFDAISLFGATDEDIEDLVCKSPSGAHRRILVGRLNNCCLTDRGLDLFITTFNQIEELELSGCNEITNAIDLRVLSNLRRLIITDCINMADGLAQRLIQMFHQLSELTIQAYHLTDAFLEYISLNSETFNLRRLALPNCKEMTNQSMLTIAKHFQQVEMLSISGSTKVSLRL